MDECFVPFPGVLHPRNHLNQGFEADHLLGNVGSVEAVDTVCANDAVLELLDLLDKLLGLDVAIVTDFGNDVVTLDEEPNLLHVVW